MLDKVASTFNHARIYYIIMFVIIFIGCVIIFSVIKRIIPLILKLIGGLLIQIITYYYKTSGNGISYFRKKNMKVMVNLLLFFEKQLYILPYGVYCIVLELKKVVEKQKKNNNRLLKLLIYVAATILIMVLDMNTRLLSSTIYGDIMVPWTDNMNRIFDQASEADAVAGMDSESQKISNEFFIPQDTLRFQLVKDKLMEDTKDYTEQMCTFESNIHIIDGYEYGLFVTSDNQAFYVKNPMQYVGTEIIPEKITASSFLSYTKSGKIIEYPTSNLTDKDFTTCWIEGKEGSGLNESINCEFSSPCTLNAINLANGFQISERSYKRNERVASVLITADGTTVGKYDLEYAQQDEFGFVNNIRFDTSVEVKSTLNILITGVDTGKCVYTDTAVSEVELFLYK